MLLGFVVGQNQKNIKNEVVIKERATNTINYITLNYNLF
jgi:hypothetical protein